MIKEIFDFKALIDNMEMAFSYHKVIFDENNIPIDYKFLYVNKAFEKLTGLKPENILNKNVIEVIPNIKREPYNWIYEYGQLSIKGGKKQIEKYFELWDKWYRIDAYSIERGYFATVFTDITQDKKKYEEIEKKENIIKQVTDNLEEATILQDVKTKDLIYISPAYSKIYGISMEEILQDKTSWKSVVYPEDINRVEERFTMENALKEVREKGVFEESYRILNNKGNIKWIYSKYIPIKNENGEIDKILGIDQDITKLKLIEEELKKEKDKAEKLALTDYLTGIYNRRAFYIRVKEEIDRVKREKGCLSFIMIDIDYFKKVNDFYGHNVGDVVLKHIVKIILSKIRGYDFVARLGGEEFVILMHADCKQAFKKAEEIRKCIENSEVVVDNDIIKYTASFGVTSFSDSDNFDVEEVLKRADNALYLSKNKGRNMVSIK